MILKEMVVMSIKSLVEQKLMVNGVIRLDLVMTDPLENTLLEVIILVKSGFL